MYEEEIEKLRQENKELLEIVHEFAGYKPERPPFSTGNYVTWCQWCHAEWVYYTGPDGNTRVKGDGHKTNPMCPVVRARSH